MIKINKSIASITNKLFPEQDSEFVALDLGSRYIKGLFYKNNRIEDIFSEENKDNTIKSSVDLLKKNDLLSKKIKISVKGSGTIIRYIAFPKVNNLKTALSYELSKYIPFPADSVYFDIFIVDENYSKTDFLIILAVAKKIFIDSLLKGFGQEKANIAEITLNNLVLINIFSITEKLEKNTAVIDMGFSSILLNLIKKNTPYLSREIKIGGINIIEKLSRAKNLDKTKAEELLINSQTYEEFEEIEEDIFSELSEEIKNSFDYFEMNTGERIHNILITGGFSKIKNIDKIISSSLGVEVKIWNPWDMLNISLSKDMPLCKEMFNVALGLTL